MLVFLVCYILSMSTFHVIKHKDNLPMQVVLFDGYLMLVLVRPKEYSCFP